MYLKEKKGSKYLESLIAEGEHQKQDFKYAINDSRKIARTLAAFANTGGGRLLLGVKDNGKVVGVISDEEYYMVETAATIHCKPPVRFDTTIIEHEGKRVLEVKVPVSQEKPHKAPTKSGESKAFIRVNDQNLVADKILEKVWEREKRAAGTLIRFSKIERILLEYLKVNSGITIAGLQELAGINKRVAERVLINLLLIKVIVVELSASGTVFKLKP